ncbi:hypothetical protein Z950_1587 [Sulfitobacter mediterraneus KCTC 32188]|nr:hypothetical protein Z950_1587 [Sulfitobacter mediterraneus KCTC 32188]
MKSLGNPGSRFCPVCDRLFRLRLGEGIGVSRAGQARLCGFHAHAPKLADVRCGSGSISPMHGAGDAEEATRSYLPR